MTVPPSDSKNRPQSNQDFANRLTPIWGKEEAAAIVRLFWDHSFGVWRTDAAFWDEVWPEEKASFINNALARLEKKEPPQYVLGEAYFMDLRLNVNPSVLIPRPETEELVYWMLEDEPTKGRTVLDLCTGSGCIALALRKKGDWEAVAGLDVSEAALDTAKKNAEKLGLDVQWQEADLLALHPLPDERWDVWVSNPPYVKPSESSDMSTSVLDFEPRLALFVGEKDALVFYRIILSLGQKHLKPGGSLYFELNPLTASGVVSLFHDFGYERVELKKDMSGKDRMVRGFRP